MDEIIGDFKIMGSLTSEPVLVERNTDEDGQIIVTVRMFKADDYQYAETVQLANEDQAKAYVHDFSPFAEAAFRRRATEQYQGDFPE